MSTPDPDAARERLRAERDDAAARADVLRRELDRVAAAAAGSNADDEHDPEGATLAFERAQTAALLGQTGRRLAELELALARVEDGTYGTCERCGSTIAPARLEARPAARTCITCAVTSGTARP